MKRIIKLTNFALGYLGFNPSALSANFKGLFWFFRDLRQIRQQLRTSSENWNLKFYPILTDKYDTSGKARGQYFYQDLFVANQIFKNSPVRHIDIGSRIDGFVSHVASFRPVEVLDIRPLSDKLQNISFVQADLMNPQAAFIESTDSLSCLHTIEHFGLGRYHDPIDVDGHLKGLENMYKFLKKDGIFYFSTQIGPQRIEFNAHRIFSVAYLLDIFKGKYELQSFAYIDDQDRLFTDVQLTEEGIRANFGCRMGCGIFILKKI